MEIKFTIKGCVLAEIKLSIKGRVLAVENQIPNVTHNFNKFPILKNPSAKLKMMGVLPERENQIDFVDMKKMRREIEVINLRLIGRR